MIVLLLLITVGIMVAFGICYNAEQRLLEKTYAPYGIHKSD